MLLCRNGINLETDDAEVCPKCYNHLLPNKLPVLSLCNQMWIGDVPLQLKEFTLSE
jgi:hypothetical protein